MAKGKQGFAPMDPEKHKAIASMGGRAAHQLGVAHEFTSEEAKAAGAKGGKAAKNRYRFTSEAARAASRKALQKRAKKG
jgi:general stress protein YciG